jgi:hypothetical protein
MFASLSPLDSSITRSSNSSEPAVWGRTWGKYRIFFALGVAPRTCGGVEQRGPPKVLHFCGLPYREQHGHGGLGCQKGTWKVSAR